MESRFAAATITGPCKGCGAEVELPIPIRINSSERDALCRWPKEPIVELFCVCGEPFPLGPFPVVYWGKDEVVLILDGSRKADVILRMILSWIVDDERWQALADKQALVFGSMEDFTSTLQTSVQLYMQDIHSLLAPEDVFWETNALIEVVDGALESQKPGLAYSLYQRP